MKLKNILWIGILAAGLMGCDDYLDTPPVDTLGINGFYETALQAEQGVLGVYADLRYLAEYEYLFMSECRSCNTWVNPNANGLREYSEIGTFRATSDLDVFDDAWNAWYKVIYDANTLISKLPATTGFTDEAIKEQFMNEARFLRGWAYFELTRLFGKVPMVTTPLAPTEANTVPQSNPKTIIDEVVIPDLEAAMNLPISGDIKNASGGVSSVAGRADKIAATAMLARVYMTLYGFPYNDNTAKDKAKTYLKTVLDYSVANGNKYWAPNIDEWRKQWMPTSDYYNKYSIFAIQYRAGGSGNPAIFAMSPSLPRPTYVTHLIYGNNIYVEKTLMYEFERTFSNGQTDGRGGYDATNRNAGYSILAWYAAEGNTQEYSNEREAVTVDGVSTTAYINTMIYKYVASKPKIAALGMSLDAEGAMLNDYDWPVNLPIIRLEDIQLLYAELLVEDGAISDAMKYVNDIRTRANCDPVETDCSPDRAMYYIKRERRIEFLGEGVVWFDQIRWNSWKQDSTDKFARYNNPTGTNPDYVRNYLYPIPLNQMNVTPGLYDQNEGY